MNVGVEAMSLESFATQFFRDAIGPIGQVVDVSHEYGDRRSLVVKILLRKEKDMQDLTAAVAKWSKVLAEMELWRGCAVYSEIFVVSKRVSVYDGRVTEK